MSLVGRLFRVEEPTIDGHLFEAVFIGLKLGQITQANAKTMVNFQAGEMAQWNQLDASFQVALLNNHEDRWLQALEAALVLASAGKHFTLSNTTVAATELLTWMQAAE